VNARRDCLTVCLALTALACVPSGCSPGAGPSAERAPAPPDRFGLGRAATSAEVAALDIDVDTTGAGLPPGEGTPASGAVVFARTCAKCHGANGEGIAPAPQLIGREPRQGFPFGRDVKLVHTVGNYWPFATTLYDYVHRAMPQSAPGSLTPDEVYGVIAYLLAANQIIPATAVVNARTLPAVRMPARSRFVIDDRGVNGTGFR
jgi:cytochrome c